ncbi:MAG: energy-coupling factor transport system ATP-binding protein [Actinomycetota bacterium]|nr:energy-coupling factor transport system ATP-binding protein [Actinomycetota bacterium]
MIEFDRVGLTYPEAPAPVLTDVRLHIEEGELCLVIGHTGTGKSSLLGTLNGLVPHFTGGSLTGRVTVAGRDTARTRPRDLADVVGVVGQDPVAGFVTDTVEEELAYTMEQLAVPPQAMRTRVEQTLDLLGIADLRRRSLLALSGGQQQRVAIGAALTARPEVLVLDEPTSALDPVGAEEVLATVTRLVHDLGITVVLAEHRLERVVQYADRIIHLPGDGTVACGEPGEVLATAGLAPPVIELGRAAGWDPLPLSVRDARRRAAPLRERLSTTMVRTRAPEPKNADSPTLLDATRLRVRHGRIHAVRDVDLRLRAGEIVALMGRNGSGKSSLLWALAGAARRAGGRLRVARPEDDGGVSGDGGTAGGGNRESCGPGVDPVQLPPDRARRLVALVPQTPTDLLYLDTVDQELCQADLDAAAGNGSGEGGARGPSTGRGLRPARVLGETAGDLLERLVPGIDRNAHPRDLSAGQQLGLVLAIQLCGRPQVLLLDEPTRGLDYRAKTALAVVLTDLAARGHAIVVATHDVEFAATACRRVLVLAEGEVVAEGPARTVLTASPAFAPQVAKILAPVQCLTVREVVQALDEPATGARR